VEVDVKTASEIILHLTGKKNVAGPQLASFQTVVWLRRLLTDQNLSLSKLDAILSAHLGKEVNGLPHKWNSSTVIRRKSVEKVARIFPGSQEVFYWPLFELLQNKVMSKNRIRILLRRYRPRGKHYSPVWKFPNDEELKNKDRYFPILLESDSDALFQRADLHGFTAILGLVRLAEAQRYGHWHQRHMMNAFRALPSIAKMQEFSEHFETIKTALLNLQSRVITTNTSFAVNWEIINKQIQSTDFEPYRYKRKYDDATGLYEEPEDPIIYFADHLLI